MRKYSSASSATTKKKRRRLRPSSARKDSSGASSASAFACDTLRKSPSVWTTPLSEEIASIGCCDPLRPRRARMSQADRLAQLAEAMLRHDSFVITCHVDPDPDCIGSMLALEWGLTRLGKRVTMVSSDPVKEDSRFLPGA